MQARFASQSISLLLHLSAWHNSNGLLQRNVLGTQPMEELNFLQASLKFQSWPAESIEFAILAKAGRIDYSSPMERTAAFSEMCAFRCSDVCRTCLVKRRALRLLASSHHQLTCRTRRLLASYIVSWNSNGSNVRLVA